MRTYSILLFGASLLACIAPRVAVAQFQTPTPEELKMTSDPKAPGAPAVYLYREEKEDDPHQFKTVYARVKVLTDLGKEAATVHVVYQKHFVFYAGGDNSSRMASGTANSWSLPDMNHAGEDARIDTNAYGGKIEVAAIEGRVIHTDGSITPLTVAPADLVKTKEGNSQFNDMTFTLPNVQVGDILEYRYQVRYDRFRIAPEWQIQQPYFVHKARYVFTPDEQFQPQRNHGGTGAGMSTSAMLDSHGQVLTDIRSVNVLPKGAEVKQDGQGDWFVDLTDIPAIPDERFSPPLLGQIYQVNFFYTNTPDSKEFWQKEMQLWQKDVNLYTAATPAIKNAAAELTAGLTSPLDKAKKLYAAVQKFENTSFSGNNPPFVATDYVPRGSVDTILERKAGNTEELTLLYLALAKAAGLEARPDRIASRTSRMFSTQFMDTTQLDTVLIGIMIDGKEVIVDPGQKMAPFQTLLWSHAGAGGVAMGFNGKVETILTPLQQNGENASVRVGTLTVTAQGTVTGTLKVGFTGQEALLLRQLAVRDSPDAAKSRLEHLIAQQVPSGVEAHIERLANLDDPDKQLVAIVPVTGTLADHAGTHLALPRLFFETKASDPFPSESNRALPIDVQYPALEQEQITYNLPDGYALDGTLQDATWKWEDNAAYQVRTKAATTSITTARVLIRAFTILEPSEYGKLRDFYDKVATADHQQVVLTAAHSTGQ